MSTTATSPAAAHAHDEHHGHHVSSMRMLVTVFLVLIGLTILTVYTAKFIDLGFWGNFILAMAIASSKALLVCAFFMHLLHDNKFNSVILFYCILTLGTFILFTAIDLESRAAIDIRREGAIQPPAMVEEARAAYEEKKKANSGSAQEGADGDGNP
jgi:cytochrome c oxidase subunit 4